MTINPDGRQSLGALSGSREPDPCCTGSGPSGFDPERIAEVVRQIEPTLLAPIIKKAADEFYCAVLETAQDYLQDNLDWNLKSHLAMLERENQRMRTELWEVDRKLGGNMLGPDNRIKSIGELHDASCGYHQLVWEVARKFDGETRHETALRYIREREAASAIEARSDATVKQGAAEGESASDAQRPTP